MKLIENDAPLATIAMVTYNSSKYVGFAIESALCQSYANLELIICDDCSTDDTWDIICTYNDPRIRAYRNEKNLGEYPNRNKALELATGEYIIYIDGDDIIYPHGLEFMVRMLHAFPDCAMALMRWFRNNIIYPVIISPNKFYIGEFLGEGFLGTAFSNVLFRTSIIKIAGGLPENYIAGDDYIRYKIALTNNSLLINDGLTWWRETPGQASQRHKKSNKLFIESYKMRIKFLKDANPPLNNLEKEQALSNIYRIIGKVIIKQIFNFNFLEAIRITKAFNISVLKLFYWFKRPYYSNPLAEYTTVNPYILPFYSNPFSNNYNKK